MASSKTVDSALWWDPFTPLLTDLENASLSAEAPPSLVKKLKDNHSWFLETVFLFRKPNEKSREALNSEQVQVGSHRLSVKPELKEKALQISAFLCLDEVQSYILVKRSLENINVAVDSVVQEFTHVILLQYYIERQCLLKCTRQILMHALHAGAGSQEGDAISEMALKLISDGFESKIISVLQGLLSSSYPEHMDVDLFTLWAEETLIEDNLILDIIFLAYYESFCTCNGEQWRKLCSIYKGILCGAYNFSKLAISSEVLHSSYQAQVQLLLILIETLDLENLLQMVHDEIPFRQGTTVFSLMDVREMDAIVSGFNAYETKEAGPLILTWAVFLCLITSLPRKEENDVLMEIDHVGYVRQAFEAASLGYFLEILQSDLLKEADGPIAGYRSVLRTFISAFIASYEINIQLEDSTLNLILDILCEIYRGEESLCSQFWDKDSFIDGPIRCLLCNLEGEFPYRTVELVRFLSSLCDGTWPTECVYTFLDKSVGISSLFEISSDSMVDSISQIVESRVPLHIPGIEGLLIPSKTRGHVLKVVDGNTALVRWEYTQSGLLVLLLHMAQEQYMDGNEEVLLALDLLSRMVSFNKAVCFGLMDIGNLFHIQTNDMNGHIEKNPWVVEIVCNSVKKLSPNPISAAMMSLGVSILANMLKCAPFHVAAVTLKANIFDMALKNSIFDDGSNDSSGGLWLLSGKLAKMLLIDCEQNDSTCALTISVLDFTIQLLETGLENDTVLALVVFSMQYVLVNHEYWKYKVKNARWKVTLKVLEVMKKCILATSCSEKLGEAIRNMLLSDSSIHSTLFRVVCITTQGLEKLYVSRLYELMEIEGLELAISSVLDILFIMLFKFSKDISSSLPVFHQAVLSSMTKPIHVVGAAISLISYFRNNTIQVGAARVLSMLLIVANYLQPYAFGNACFGLDDNQVTDLRHSIKTIVSEQSAGNEDLLVAVINLLTSATYHQPSFLVALFAVKENADGKPSDGVGTNPITQLSSAMKPSLLDALLPYVERSDDQISSNPRILLNVLNFLKALWQGAAQYTFLLESLKSSEKFWKRLSSCITVVASNKTSPYENLTETEAMNLSCKYQCHSTIFEMMARDIFLQKKLLHADSLAKQNTESKGRTENAESTVKSKSTNVFELNDILSTWCKSSVLGGLIESYISCEYNDEIYFRAKVATILFTIHAMGKITTGNTGSISISLLEKIRVISDKLSSQPAFLELLAQYTQRGYSEGKELRTLVLNDLYYHLEGELEGREIGPGPFKELFQYLLASKFLQTYQNKYDSDLFTTAKEVYLFDTVQIHTDLGLDMWHHSGWKESKTIAETMLRYMQDANSVALVGSSKLLTLRALTTLLTVYDDDLVDNGTKVGGKIPGKLTFSYIDHICQCLNATTNSLAPVLDAPRDILNYLVAQAELLLHLMRSALDTLPLPVCVLVLKTAGSGLRVLTDARPSISEAKITVRLLLTSLLLAVEVSCLNSPRSGDTTGLELVEDFSEVCNASLGILPVLCDCIATGENYTLALSAMDLILRSLLTPNTWFPIILKHLQLRHLILSLQDKASLESAPVVLKFSLTLARTRGGTQMLLNAGFFSSLRALFSDLSVSEPVFVANNDRSLATNSTDGAEKLLPIWGLGIATVTGIVHHLGDTSSADIVDDLIPYFFSEKAYLVSYYLEAPDFPSDFHDKKRPRTQRTNTSLSNLKETEQTLLLMCALAKHRTSWIKGTKEIDSQLREKCIHFLAFISRGTTLKCPPVLKEEFEFCRKPSFVNSRNGWFALSALCSASRPKLSVVPSTALVVKDQTAGNNNNLSQTYFSDSVAIQIYRIAFLLLKFLCLQAEGAAKRAEEVGFIDLAHFPELPMPEILHGLQDQASAIVTELCNASRSKQVQPELQGICLLLLQIMEMSLYLELCVLQICGIRPVMGRLEDFSKELKSLIQVSEGQVFLKSSVKALKQIVSVLHPRMLQTEGLL